MEDPHRKERHDDFHLRSSDAEVYVATSWEELDRIRSEVVFEMLVVDPVFRLV